MRAAAKLGKRLGLDRTASGFYLRREDAFTLSADAHGPVTKHFVNEIQGRGGSVSKGDLFTAQMLNDPSAAHRAKFVAFDQVLVRHMPHYTLCASGDETREEVKAR